MKPRTYYSQRTRAAHTYDFYWQRQNDPQWRDDFLRITAQRKRERRKHYRNNLIGTVIIIAAILFAYPRYLKPLLQSSGANVTTTTTAHHSSVESSRSATSSSTPTQTTTTESLIITNYQAFNSYAGTYQNHGEAYQLNFTNKSLTYTGPAKEQHYTFDKMIQHPDGSLVINVHGNYHYNAYQGRGEQTTPVYLSVLLAPKDIKIQKNWQTNQPLTDTSDSSHNRFAIAQSNDQGKIFQMTPAYTAFADNHTSNSVGTPVLYATTN